MPPYVSVILPAYNVELYIEDAISSILEQTLVDFELLVVDDCSTDNTAAKVQAIRDQRLRFIQNSRNLGRAGADNAAIPHVRGKFIAKMDGDDLCHPERLAKQVKCLENHRLYLIEVIRDLDVDQTTSTCTLHISDLRKHLYIIVVD